MRKLLVLFLFLTTGLPVLHWALPEAWWNKVDAALPPELLQYSTQLAQQPAAWFESYIRIFAIAWLAIFVIDLIANQSIGAWSLGKDGRGFEAVDDAVPHARFRRTEDGFKVTMRNNDGLGGGIMFFFLTALTAGIWYLVVREITNWLVITTILGVALGYFAAWRLPTTVEVRQEAVITTDHRDGQKKLDRNQFTSFTPNHGWLGRTYGLRNEGFGGNLGKGIIVEIASALNRLMQNEPRSRQAYTATSSRPETYAPPETHTPRRRYASGGYTGTPGRTPRSGRSEF